MNKTAQEIFEILNDTDESRYIEAKEGHESGRSVMETVCAFSNEPDLVSGYIILGLTKDTDAKKPTYKVVSIGDTDKLQSDIATQCASMFNIPVRPRISVEKIDGGTVVKICIDELPSKQKPLFFKSDGLPRGAFRRIGSTDQRCTEDDMPLFFMNTESYDQTPAKGVSTADVDPSAIIRYRSLRESVNPAAEELAYADQELLEALGCVSKENRKELNLAGLLLFGSAKAQRSTYPMLRVDYIRVPGNTWVHDPDLRFSCIDMRGPLLLLIYRLMDAINADLPKGFLLQEPGLQAASPGLPIRALREAVVNAVMHRSYRVNRPIQIIRYDNRIEIINPGYSLKPEDRLGLPGSETRNPFIASVFHDTNLAETKGSGIRAMRKMMQDAHFAPPTFESNRECDEFTSRLLLHHFLDEVDITWLMRFEHLDLSDYQKLALVYVRETGAINNQTYRQMVDCETVKASIDLRFLKSHKVLVSKGKSRTTYYVPGPQFHASVPLQYTRPPLDQFDEDLIQKRSQLNDRERNAEKVMAIIEALCTKKSMKAAEIAMFLNKSESYVKRKYLAAMISNNRLKYLHPNLPNHPGQAYRVGKMK